MRCLCIELEYISINHWLFSFLPTVAGEGVRFSFRGTTYQNNSLVTLEDIGEGDDALLCLTDQPACCRSPYNKPTGQTAIGNWFFPNGTRVPSSGSQWDFHRTRGPSKVLLHRRRGGVYGIHHCDIPDAAGVDQKLYIGVYSASTGEWHTHVHFYFPLYSFVTKITRLCVKFHLRSKVFVLIGNVYPTLRIYVSTC